MPGEWRGREKEAEHRGFLGQRSYSAWYRNGGSKSLHICPNPQNVNDGLQVIMRCQWRIFTCTHGPFWRPLSINGGSSLVTHGPFWRPLSITGGDACGWGGVMREIAVSFTPCCCEPQTALKNVVCLCKYAHHLTVSFIIYYKGQKSLYNEKIRSLFNQAIINNETFYVS